MEFLIGDSNIYRNNYFTDKKKIFVYDTSRGISRLVKKNLSNAYDVICCCNFKSLNNFNLEGFHAAIVIINDYEDFIKISEMKANIDLILTSSSVKKDFFEYPIIDNVIIFDLNLKRKEMIRLFQKKLIAYETNKTNT